MNRKLLFFILCILLLFSVEVQSASTLEGVTVSLPNALIITPNLRFSFPIGIKAVSGVQSFIFELNYDQTKLSVNTVSKANSIFKAFSIEFRNVSPGRLRVSGAGSSAVADSGTLVEVIFDVLETASGTSTISISPNFQFNDGALSGSVTNVTNVTISTPTISFPSNIPIIPGQSIAIPVYISDLTNTRFTSYQFNIIYDQSAVTFNGVSTQNTISAKAESLVVNTGTGTGKVSAAGTSVFTGSGVFIYLNFTVSGTLTSATTIQVTNFIFNETAQLTSISGTLTPADVTISLPNALVLTPNLRFSFPIGIKAVSGVKSFIFELNYDQTKLSVNTVSKANSIFKAFSIEFQNVSPGLLRVSGAGSFAVADSGTLVEVIFDVLETASGTSTISILPNFKFNDGALKVGITNVTNVTISTPTISFPSDTTVTSGQSISIPIYVSDLTNTRFTSYQFNVSYNQSAVTFNGVSTQNTISATAGTPVVNTGTGTGKVSAAGTGVFTGSGVFIYLNFTVSGTLTSATTIQVTNFILNETAQLNTISRTLTPTIVGNVPPVIPFTTTTITGIVGEPLSYTIPATDPNGDPLTFTFSGQLPSGMTFMPAERSIMGTPGQSGSFSITVVVSDGQGGTTSATVVLQISTGVVPTVNRPPVIPFTSQTIGGHVGESFSYTIPATDLDGDQITFSFVGQLPPGLTFTNGVISGVPTAAGSYPSFFVSASDGKGGIADATLFFEITVVGVPGVNRVPVIAFETITVPGVVGQTLSYTIPATDPDGDALTYSLTGQLPSGITFMPVMGNMAGMPSQAGDFPLTIIVSDGKGGADTATVTLQISSGVIPGVNRFPVITFDSAMVPGAVGQPLSYTVPATDPDFDALTYSFTGELPSGVTVMPGMGSITGNPSQSGNFPLTVIVSDGKGGADTAKVVLQISPGIVPGVNQPPVIAFETTSVEGVVGQPLSYTIPATDPDFDALTYSLTGQLPSGITFMPVMGFITGMTNQTGTFPLRVIVSDGKGGADTATVTLQISSGVIPGVNRPPVIAFDSTIVPGAVGEPLTYTIPAMDPDFDALTYSFTGELPSGVTFMPVMGSMTGMPGQAGSFQLRVIVLDGKGGADTATVVLQISPGIVPGVNQPPVIAFETTSVEGVVGEPLSYTIPAFDPDNDVLSFTFTGQLPTGVSFMPVGGLIVGIPSQTGVFPLRVIATDGKGGADTATVSLQISAGVEPGVNRPPVIGFTTEMVRGIVNQPFSFTIPAIDPDNDMLSFTYAGQLPSGVTFMPAFGNIMGTPGQSGTFSITIMVSDGKGGADTASVTLEISSVIQPGVNAPPVIAYTTETVKGILGTMFTYMVPAFDPNMDILTFSFTDALPSGITTSSNGTISGTPAQLGTFPLRVIVSDGKGGADTATVILDISSGVVPGFNRPPFIALTAERIQGIIGETLSFTVYATDMDMDTLTFTFTGTLPSGVTATRDGIISGIPNQSGTFPLRVEVSDGKGGTDSRTITLEIISPVQPGINSLPVIAFEKETVQGIVGQPLYYTVPATDMDMDVLTFTFSGMLPSGVTTNNRGVIVGIPNRSGVFPLRVIVSDGKGGADTAAVALEISSAVLPGVNRPPVITFITETVKGIVGRMLSYSVPATDADMDVLTFIFSGFLPSGVKATNSGLIFGMPTQIGAFPLRVIVSDGKGGADTATVILEISTPANTPPVLSFITKTFYGRVDQPLFYDIGPMVTDVDMDTLTFTFSGTLPSGITVTTTGIISGTPDQSGTFPLQLVVSDGKGGVITASITLEISAGINNPPVFSRTELSITINERIPFDFYAGALASDPDLGDVLNFSVITDPAIPDLEIDTTRGQISWQSPIKGTYAITVNATDISGLLASLVVNLTVKGDTIPPLIVQKPNVFGLTQNSAVIVFASNKPSSSVLGYRPLVAGGDFNQITDTTFQIDHSITISNLDQNTTYEYTIRLIDVSGNQNNFTSPLYRFTTLTTADTTKPVLISKPIVFGLTDVSATIVWETDKISTSFIQYGTDTLSMSTFGDAKLVRQHSVTLTNLSGGTRYFYRVISTDASGNTFTGIFRNFTTKMIADITPPTFVMSPVAQSITSISANILWKTDEISTSEVSYRKIDEVIFQVVKMEKLVQDHNIILTNLSSGISYRYFVVSIDNSKNKAVSDTFTFSTLAVQDTSKPKLISGPTILGKTESQAIIRWITDKTGDSYVNYGLSITYDQTRGEPKFTKNHEIQLTNLSPGKVYHYQISTTDASDNVFLSGDFTFTTELKRDTVPPVIISGPVVKERSSNTAMIEWNTDESSTSTVNFGDSPDLREIIERPDFLNKHIITLTRLLSNTTYYYRVSSGDVNGNSVISNVNKFITLAEKDTTAPKITVRPNLKTRTNNSAIIEWVTDKLSDSKVEYGIASSLGSEVVAGDNVTNHSILLVNLSSDQKYFYRVSSRDISGNSVTSDILDFTTKSETAETRLILLKAPFVSLVTENSAIIEWETNFNSTSRVDFGLNVDNLTTKEDIEFTTQHKVILTNLESSTLYVYRVRSFDVNRNEVNSGERALSFYTRAVQDLVPPDIIEIPFVSNVASNSATIQWKTNEPSNSIVEYGRDQNYSDGPIENADRVINHIVTLTNLQPNTNYFAFVRSSDQSGNTRSTDANPLRFKTKVEKEIIPPRIIRGPIVVATTVKTATIEWETDKRADGFIQYGLSREQLNPPEGTSELSILHNFVLTDLIPNSLYHFIVSSTDAEGNRVETRRIDYTFRTERIEDTTPPVLIEGPIVYSTERSASFLWVTDEPSTSVIYYKEDIPTIIPEKVMIPDLTREHSVILTGLNLGKNYIFVLASTDFSGNVMTFPSPVPAGFGALYKTLGVEMSTQPPGGNGRFRTTQRPDNQKPVIVSGPLITNKTASTVTIVWKTDEPSNSFIEFGKTNELGDLQGSSRNDIEHNVTLTNLNPATTYYYRTSSTDINSNGPAYSGTSVTTTSSEADIIPPVIKAGPTVASLTDNQATILWDTDEPGNSKVEYSLSSDFVSDQSKPRDTRSVSEYLINHKITLTNLIPDTVYYYRVSSSDINQNGPTFSTVLNFRTEAQPDKTPPQIVGSPKVVSVTDSTANISWKTNELSNSFVKFDSTKKVQKRLSLQKEEQDIELFEFNVGDIRNVTEHLLTITNLTPNTPYNFIVGSLDISKNESTSPIASFETAAMPDRTPPEVPDTVIAEAGDRAIYLKWNAIPNAAGDLSGYNIYREKAGVFVPIATNITDTYYYDFGIDNNVAYSYVITSIDKIQPPNESAYSKSISATPGTNAVPSIPLLKSPAKGATITQTNRPTFTIRNVTSIRKPVTYDFAIARDSLFLDLALYKTGVAEGTDSVTSFIPDAGLENGSYYWRVRANDGIFTGPWLETSTFKIDYVTAVELSIFEAKEQEGIVLFHWETSVEIGNVGFNILRSLTETDGYELINNELIQTRSDHIYNFKDDKVEVGQTYYYRLESVGLDGLSEMYKTIQISITTPKTFVLHQNYPNPFNPITNIKFELPKASLVTIKIYNILGQEVKNLLNEKREPGYHIIQWNGTNNAGIKVSSGIYIYRIRAGKFVQSKKMVFMK